MIRLNRSILCSLVLFVLSQPAFSQDDSLIVGNPNLRLFLLNLEEVDQGIRAELAAKGVGYLDEVDIARQKAIDEANQAHLEKIVDRYGWPTRYMVGEDGVAAAFLILQHGDPVFQKRMMPLLEQSFERGDLSGGQYALITDRVLLNEGRRQRYGTQAKITNGQLILDPIEDRANVDKRREALGLEKLADYVRELEKIYGFKAQYQE